VTNLFIITTAADLFSLVHRCKQAWDKPQRLMSFPTGAGQYSAGPTRDLKWPIGISLCRPGRVGGFWWIEVMAKFRTAAGTYRQAARHHLHGLRAFQILEQFRECEYSFWPSINQCAAWHELVRGIDWRGYYFWTTSHRHFLGFLSFKMKYVHLNNCFHSVLLLLPFNCVAESTVESSNL
jgi:hypothetical protein